MRPSAAVSTLLFFGCVAAGVFVGWLGFASTKEPASLGIPIFLGIVAGVFLSASVKVVAQWERMIVLRLGKFRFTAEPGLRLLMPILDTAMFVEMRVQTVPIAQQQAITKDNVRVVDRRPGPSASNTVVLALPLEIIDMMRAYIAKSERSH
jgi:hypothetical protein